MKIIPIEGVLSENQISNIKRWIEALRSGQYQQGIGTLRCGDQYCCLGVACEINQIPYDDGYIFNRVKHERYPSTSWFLQEFGFDYNRLISGDDDLARLNDKGYLFDQIADLIEKTFIKKDN